MGQQPEWDGLRGMGGKEGCQSASGCRQAPWALHAGRTFNWPSCSLAALSHTTSTFCRSTEASMYCRHSCSRRQSWKLRASLYTSMTSSTSSTWPAAQNSLSLRDARRGRRHGAAQKEGQGPGLLPWTSRTVDSNSTTRVVAGGRGH